MLVDRGRVVRCNGGRLLEPHDMADAIAVGTYDAALAEVAKVGFDPLYGARPLKRAIQQKIENPISRLVLEGRFGADDVIDVGYADGDFTFGVKAR